ncbi:MAG: hypothetical protein ACE5OZ_22290 [Candidatus Heimdallarchaeota archaeon]
MQRLEQLPREGEGTGGALLGRTEGALSGGAGEALAHSSARAVFAPILPLFFLAQLNMVIGHESSILWGSAGAFLVWGQLSHCSQSAAPILPQITS